MPGKNTTIELVSGVGAVPDDPTIRKNGPKGPPDRVRWWNRTDRGHTITFTNWPFTTPPGPIHVDPGTKSDWYDLYASTPNGYYDYSIEPTINPPSGPPGEPGIIIDD